MLRFKVWYFSEIFKGVKCAPIPNNLREKEKSKRGKTAKTLLIFSENGNMHDLGGGQDPGFAATPRAPPTLPHHHKLFIIRPWLQVGNRVKPAWFLFYHIKKPVWLKTNATVVAAPRGKRCGRVKGSLARRSYTVEKKVTHTVFLSSLGSYGIRVYLLRGVTHKENVLCGN